MFKTYSSSSTLVITSRWFATSRLATLASVRLVYWCGKQLHHSYGSNTQEDPNWHLLHAKAQIKWLPFHTQHFQIHFLVWKLSHFYSKFTEIWSQSPVDDMPPLVQMMAWWQSGRNHYMNQRWYSLLNYRKVSNIRRTLVGNKIVDHSDVVGASPVGAAPTTSSFST